MMCCTFTPVWLWLLKLIRLISVHKYTVLLTNSQHITLSISTPALSTPEACSFFSTPAISVHPATSVATLLFIHTYWLVGEDFFNILILLAEILFTEKSMYISSYKNLISLCLHTCSTSSYCAPYRTFSYLYRSVVLQAVSGCECTLILLRAVWLLLYAN